MNQISKLLGVAVTALLISACSQTQPNVRQQQENAAEQAEAEKRAAEKAEAERRAREQAEAERRAREQAEAERRARERAEAERRAREKAEAERRAREKAEAERRAREKAEAERRAREKAEAERRAAEKAAAEKKQAEQTRQAAAKPKQPADSGPVVTSKIPDYIEAFIAKDLAAVQSQDPAKVMALYHEDFLSDGRDYATQESLFFAYGAAFASKWDIDIKKVKIEENKVTILEGTGETNYGVADLAGTLLVKENGRWLWYGNRKL